MLVAAPSQDPRHKRATDDGGRTRAGGGRSRTASQDAEADRIAAEVRDVVRRAAGDVAGLTVAAQIRQSARHLGFPADHWRVREAWYGRGASPAALDDLKQRYAAWRQPEAARIAERLPVGIMDMAARPTLAQRVDAIRAGLEALQRQVEALAAEVEAAVNGAQR